MLHLRPRRLRPHDLWKGGSPIEGTTPLQAYLGDKNIRPEARSTQRSPMRSKKFCEKISRVRDKYS